MPLHPQAAKFVEQISAQTGPSWHELLPTESRELFNGFTENFGEGPDLDSVEDRTVCDHVPVRIYRPSNAANLPVVVYFHGGGWVLGNLDTHDTLCRRIAKESGFVVISVDYRLAPENKYPHAFNDCYAATKYIAEHASELDIDSRRLIVAGDSAGGNLAATVSLKSRDEDRPTIQAQVLIYPVIEPNFETGSYMSFATGHGLTRESMQWFWQQYTEDSTADRQYVELTTANVNGLPSAHIVTAEYDVLRDEGENYAARLSAAGVQTTTKRYKGMIHGFVHLSGLFDDGISAVSDMAKVIQQLAE